MELWKAVKGFENYYEISTEGRLRNIRQGNILKARKHNAGYLSYVLSVKGTTTYRLAHILVAEAFIPNPYAKRTVNHKDCNKYNNNVNNLEWMTHSENHKHAFKNGRKNPNAFELGVNKLTEEDVKFIRKHYISGHKEFGACPLARRYKMSAPCILKVVKRISYKSVI